MAYSDSNQTSLRSISILYIFLVIALVFKLQFTFGPLQSVSEFASINSEDIAILLLGLTVAGQHLRDRDRHFKLILPRISSVYFILSVWILITVLVAMFRSSESVVASLFWTVKSFEVLVFFFLIQQHLDRRLGYLTLRLITLSGFIVSIIVLALALAGIERPAPFFENPNVISSFLILAALLPLSKLYVLESSRVLVVNTFLTLFPILAILSTLSRGGILGLSTGVVIITLSLYKQVSKAQLAVMTSAVISALIAAPFIIGSSGIKRITNWFTFENGKFELADTAAAYSIRARIDLLEKGIDLFTMQPIFGHGWYAAPSRVGWLDIYYSVIAVEVGVVGILLFATFHFIILKRMWTIRSQGCLALGSAVFAWQAGLLAQGVAGPFFRIPQITFISLLTISAVWVLRDDPD